MPKIRVLVVDDSVLVRKLMTNVIFEDPGLEIAGTASNGRLALAMIPQVNPDIITLDVQMPEMNGLQALEQIRKLYPKLPVIMVSSFTEQGAAETIDALTLGANDYISKPSKMGSFEAAMKKMKDDLIPKIRALCLNGNKAKAPSVQPIRPAKPAVKKSKPMGPRRVDLLAIGCSTGGPNALTDIMPLFPKDFPVPVLIVQHMPPTFTRLLAERLDAKCALQVREATSGQIIQPGQVWIAPGDYHMVAKRDGTAIKVINHQTPPENSCRPSVDVLFRSVADVYGQNALALILTGMGQDGLRGCEHITEQGGRVFVQDQASSVVWGMPGFVAEAGLAEKVLPLSQLATETIRTVVASQTSSGLGRVA